MAILAEPIEGVKELQNYIGISTSYLSRDTARCSPRLSSSGMVLTLHASS